MNMFMIYVNKSDLGEGYSGAFGIDTNHTSTTMGNVVIYAGVPVSDATPEPTITAQPTVMPTVVVPTVQVPTPEPATVTPEPAAGLLEQIPVTLILVVALLVILALAAIVVYFKFLRKGLMKRVKKK
jgi:hypothetical protein